MVKGLKNPCISVALGTKWIILIKMLIYYQLAATVWIRNGTWQDAILLRFFAFLISAKLGSPILFPPSYTLPHPSIHPFHSGSSNGAYGSHKVCFYAKLKSSYSLSPTQTLSNQHLKLPLNVQYLFRYARAPVAQWVKN